MIYSCTSNYDNTIISASCEAAAGLPESAVFHLEQLMISVPEEYTITHFAGGAMPNDFRSIFSSSRTVPIC